MKNLFFIFFFFCSLSAELPKKNEITSRARVRSVFGVPVRWAGPETSGSLEKGAVGAGGALRAIRNRAGLTLGDAGDALEEQRVREEPRVAAPRAGVTEAVEEEVEPRQAGAARALAGARPGAERAGLVARLAATREDVPVEGHAVGANLGTPLEAAPGE